MKDKHTHSFDRPVTQKVRLYAGLGAVSAIDTLKQWQCACGKRLTYELDRKYA